MSQCDDGGVRETVTHRQGNQVSGLRLPPTHHQEVVSKHEAKERGFVVEREREREREERRKKREIDR